jgi:hypothetical protein
MVAQPIQRGAALGLLVALLVAVEAVLVSPWLAWQADLAARGARAEALLARSRAALSALQDAPPAAVGGGALLAATEEGLAAAELQTLLRAAASAEGLVPATVQVEPVTALPGFRRIAVRASLRGKFAPLMGLLARLERMQQPRLGIVTLEIQVVGTGEDPDLAMGFELGGLIPEASP